MKMKKIYLIGIAIVLLIYTISYFKPIPISYVIGENDRIDITINEYEIKNGEPSIKFINYKDITVEQRDCFLTLLETYKYRRTFSTLFSNGSITDLDDKTVTIFVYEENSSVATIVVSPSEKIIVNDKSYGMKDAEQLVKEIIEIVEEP